MKILFLDIDGVVNCKTTTQRHNGFIGIDPYMAFLVGKIKLDTGCDVVLSSAWRHSEDGKQEVRDRVVDFIGVTPSCCTGIRGAEIHHWIKLNVPYDEPLTYAILDDSSDMLLWQKDNFFQTSWETGITEEIANAVTEHLGRI